MNSEVFMDKVANALKEHALQICFIQLYDNVPFPKANTAVNQLTPKEEAALLLSEGREWSVVELEEKLQVTEEDTTDLAEATKIQGENEARLLQNIFGHTICY